MGSYWETQRQLATANLYAAGAEAGSALKERWNAKRKGKEMDERVRKAYKMALEQAKTTGNLAEEFQSQVPIDMLGKEIGVKAVALRELGKNVPKHPLVVSETCRQVVGQVTLVNYNRADRPVDDDGVIHYSDYAPDEEAAESIFKAFPG